MLTINGRYHFHKNQLVKARELEAAPAHYHRSTFGRVVADGTFWTPAVCLPELRSPPPMSWRHPAKSFSGIWTQPTSQCRQPTAADDPEAYRDEIEERLFRLRSPFRAAMKGDVVDLIDPRDTRMMACKFVKLAQPMLAKLAQRPKRAVRP